MLLTPLNVNQHCFNFSTFGFYLIWRDGITNINLNSSATFFALSSTCIIYSLEEKTVEMCCRFWFPGCLICQMIESIPGPPTILREDFWYWGCQWHIARWNVIWKYYPGQGHNQLLQCSNVTRSQASKVTSPEKGRLNRRQTLLIQLCGWILLNCFGLTPPHLIWKCYARCSWAPGDFERSSWNSDSIWRVQDSNWCLHW